MHCIKTAAEKPKKNTYTISIINNKDPGLNFSWHFNESKISSMIYHWKVIFYSVGVQDYEQVHTVVYMNVT